MKLLHSVMALCVCALCAAAWAAAPALSTDAPPKIPVKAPKGRIIIAGADAAGPDGAYALTYVADEAVARKPLQVALRVTIQVEELAKDPKTGQDVKRRVGKTSTKFVPVTFENEGRVTVSLAEAGKDGQLELGITADAKEGAPFISNSFRMVSRGGTWMLVEAEEALKVAEAAPSKAQAAPARPRKVLCYTAATGFYHSSIPLGARAVAIMGRKTGAWETVISNDKFMFEPETLAQFDAVVMMETTGSLFGEKDKTVNDRLRKSLLDFVAGGKGLAGSHAATDCSYDWKEYGELIGAYFTGHPYGKHVVKIDDPRNPVNAAFRGEGFPFSDEMYVFGPRGKDGKEQPYSREKLRVLLSIDVEKSKIDPKAGRRDDGDYAISWIKRHGEGRVFYCSYGHDHRVWMTPTILQHYCDGIQYALGDLKADDTPSAKKGAAADIVPRVILAAEASDGFVPLFNGTDFTGWMNAAGKAPGAGWTVVDGAMMLDRSKGPGGDIWTKERFGDFILDLEFKTEGNSGIFIRTDNPRDNVQTGIEIQVLPPTDKPNKNSCGSIYDCLAPTKDPTKKGEWNRAVITCRKNIITVEMNGEKIIEMDLDKWTTPGKNPDGSGNKFKKALKDFSREGHIGFQDHGARVAFRNVRIKKLAD